MLCRPTPIHIDHPEARRSIRIQEHTIEIEFIPSNETLLGNEIVTRIRRDESNFPSYRTGNRSAESSASQKSATHHPDTRKPDKAIPLFSRPMTQIKLK